MKIKNIFLLLFSLIILNSFTKPVVDLVVFNATIFTVNEKQAIAQIMVVDKGKFIEIGEKELLNKYHAKKTLDAKGKFIYPGFIDAHCHFTGYALDKYKLNLSSATSFNQLIEMIVDYAKTNKHEWIEGRMWNEESWKVKTEINKSDLDKLFPNRPVFLLRNDAHAVLCNQKALDIAHITFDTKINGGIIEVKNNQLTGMLFDNAIELVKKNIPLIDDLTAIRYYQKTEKEFFENGITSFVDCMVENNWYRLISNAYQKKKMSINAILFLTNTNENNQLLYTFKVPEIKNCSVAGVKIFADGSLGSRGACLLDSYSDIEKHYGYLTSSMEEISSVAKKISSTKYQLSVHAIGDSTNRIVLEILGKYLSTKNDKRWRIEHAQVVNEHDYYLFKKYSIIPSVQPTHALSDMNMATKRLGNERLKNAFAYKKLLQQNNWLPLGTDFPVEPLNPINTFCTAVFRKDKNGNPSNGFQIENALTRIDALKGITIWAAKSVFKEKEVGSIEVGKKADFVILTTNLMKDNVQTIYNSKIISTFCEGKKVY